MSARERRVLVRAVKGFVATMLGQAVVVLQQGTILTPANVWQLLLLPALVAFLLALEKGVQPDRKGRPHG